MAKVLARGHSRVPVYSGHPKNIIGLLLVSLNLAAFDFFFLFYLVLFYYFLDSLTHHLLIFLTN